MWAAIAAGIVAAAYVGKLPPAIPLLREEFRLSLVAAGWVNSTFNTLAVTTAVFFGALAARYGALRCCTAGLIGLTLGGLLGAAATGETMLFASRIVEGAGFIAIAVSAPTLIVAASAPRQRNLTLGLWSIYLPFGASLTMLASPVLLGFIGWRGFWLVIVLLTLACMAALQRSRRAYGVARRSAAHTLADMVRALRQPGPWWLALAFGCYTLMFYAVMVWLPTFLVQERRRLGHGRRTPDRIGGRSQRRRQPARQLAGPSRRAARPRDQPHVLRHGGVYLRHFFVRPGRCAALHPGHAVHVRRRNHPRGGALRVASLRARREPDQQHPGLDGTGGAARAFFGPPLIAAVVSDAHNWGAALWVLLAAAALGFAVRPACGSQRTRAGASASRLGVVRNRDLLVLPYRTVAK